MGCDGGGKCFKGHFCGVAEYEIPEVRQLIRMWTGLMLHFNYCISITRILGSWNTSIKIKISFVFVILLRFFSPCNIPCCVGKWIGLIIQFS
jgi:hypothetical protein